MSAGVDSTPASPSFSYTPSAGDGAYSFYTLARDNATNLEDAPGAPDTSTTYDTTNPTSSATSPAATNSTSITVTYTASDATSGVKEVDLYARKGSSGAFTFVETDTTPASPSFVYTAADGEGTYQFHTRARDNATNVEDAPVSPAADTSTIYETAKPSSSAGTVANITNSNTFSVPYTASDAGTPASGLDTVELYVERRLRGPTTSSRLRSQTRRRAGASPTRGPLSTAPTASTRSRQTTQATSRTHR